MFWTEQRKMFDKTLILITTEFGQPAEFNSGGLKHNGAVGETDEKSKTIVLEPVSVPITDNGLPIKAQFG